MSKVKYNRQKDQNPEYFLKYFYKNYRSIRMVNSSRKIESWKRVEKVKLKKKRAKMPINMQRDSQQLVITEILFEEQEFRIAIETLG